MAPCGKTKCDCGCKKKTTKPKRKGAPRPRRNIPQAQPQPQPNIIMMPQPSGVMSAVSQISGTQIPKTKTTETQTEPKPKMVSTALQTEPKPKMVSMGLQTEPKPKMVSSALQTEPKPKMVSSALQTEPKPKMVSMGLQTEIPKMLTATVEQQQKEVVKPTKYQRKPITVSEIQKKEVVEPLGRYSLRSTPATALSVVGGTKPIKERKSSIKASQIERAPFLEGVIQQPTRTTIPQRKAISITEPIQPVFQEITSKKLRPITSGTNVSPPLFLTGKQYLKTEGTHKKGENIKASLKPPSLEHLTQAGVGKKLLKEPMKEGTFLSQFPKGFEVRKFSEAGRPPKEPTYAMI